MFCVAPFSKSFSAISNPLARRECASRLVRRRTEIAIEKRHCVSESMTKATSQTINVAQVFQLQALRQSDPHLQFHSSALRPDFSDLASHLVESAAELNRAKLVAYAIDPTLKNDSALLSVDCERTSTSISSVSSSLAIHAGAAFTAVSSGSHQRGCKKTLTRIANTRLFPMLQNATPSSDVLAATKPDERLLAQSQIAVESLRCWAAFVTCFAVSGEMQQLLLLLKNVHLTVCNPSQAEDDVSQSLMLWWALKLPADCTLFLIRAASSWAQTGESSLLDAASAVSYDLESSFHVHGRMTALGPSLSFALVAQLLHSLARSCALEIDAFSSSNARLFGLCESVFVESLSKMPILLSEVSSAHPTSVCLFLDACQMLIAMSSSGTEFATRPKVLRDLSSVLCRLLPCLTSSDSKALALCACLLEQLLALGYLTQALDVATIWVVSLPELVDFATFPISLVENLLVAAQSCNEHHSGQQSVLVRALLRMYRSRDWLRNSLVHPRSLNQSQNDACRHVSILDEAINPTASVLFSSHSSGCGVHLDLSEETQTLVEEQCGIVVAPGGFFYPLRSSRNRSSERKKKTLDLWN